MKAITIKQPWAYLIAIGVKDIENRTWKTNFRGRVLIHAAAKNDNSEPPLLTEEQYQLAGGVSGYSRAALGERSAIIGSVDIIDCVENHSSAWGQKSVLRIDRSGNICKEVKIYNWVLANPILFEKPILNVKGQLSLWNCSLKLIEEEV